MTFNGVSLTGRRVLVVDDNFHIATAMARLLKTRGAEIIGPIGSVEDALALIAESEHIDGAVLDINLRGETVYPVVDALRARDVPHVFMTGYDQGSIHPAYANVPCMQKPVAADHLMQALFGSASTSRVGLTWINLITNINTQQM